MSTAGPIPERRLFERWCRRCAAGGIVLLATGCGGWLPRADSVSQAPWRSFEEARDAFERIVPYRTTTADLSALGLDPFAHPNITILSYSDVIKRFIPSPQMPVANLARGVADCIAANDACRAYEIEIQTTQRKRIGNFLLDFLSFLRKTEVTGWRFNGLVLLKGNLVVYTLWGGQPQFKSLERSRNPLGPLQGGMSTATPALP